MAGSGRGQTTSGRWRIISQSSAFFGVSGEAQGADMPGETWPALAKLVSRPAAGCRSMTVTSWPAWARYQAEVTPMTPLPNTMIFKLTPYVR